MALTLRQKIGQSLIIGLRGHTLTDSEKTFIVKNNVGGVILFDRNISSPQQLHALVTEVQSLRHQLPEKSPLFISIDMEGGRVARLKAPFTQWPPAKKLGEIDSPTLGFKFAETMGKELKSVGINLDFAPCVDTLTNPANKVIGDRSLSSDPEIVGKLASALVRGYIKADVIPCAKHFPGHGNTLLDSHEDLPVENLDYDAIRERELSPFKKAFRARLDLVMTAHIKFPKIDPEWPATLSSIFLTDILRKDLGYRNLVITDDLGMKALTKNFSVEQVAVRAMSAGANILLYCNEPDHPELAVTALEKAFTDKSVGEDKLSFSFEGIQKLKKARLVSPDPLPLAEASKIIGHPEHLALSKAIQAGEVPAGLSA